MNTLKFLLIIFLMAPVMAFSMDEEDIPPPPMPEYMKKRQYKMDVHDTNEQAEEVAEGENEVEETQEQDLDRDTASLTSDEVDGQSSESIKQEFLQAGEEDVEVAEDAPVQEDVIEGSMEDVGEPEVADTAKQVYEDPLEPAPLKEVSEVDEASGEFEKANIKQSSGGPVKKANSEALADMEEKLEEAEEETEALLEESGREPSNKKPFKAGMYKFAEKCTMYKGTDALGETAGTISPGRKLWIDGHDENWHKAYKKSGVVYIPANCLQ